MAGAEKGDKKTFKRIEEFTSRDYYNDYHAQPEYHKELLCDKVLVNAYRTAILNNEQLFKGKIVLDVGCGTGLFSMWAAKAGAKQVFGVDMTSFAQVAQKIVKKNGFENVVTIIQGRVDEIQLPVEKVDVIISNWVGKCLFRGSRIKSVIFARDKWLIPNGVILPDQVTLYITGIEDFPGKQNRVGFWDNMFGFKMTSMKEEAAKSPVSAIFGLNSVRKISNYLIKIATSIHSLVTFDINTATRENLNMRLPFRLEARQKKKVTALLTWLSILFSKSQPPINLDTSPNAPYTHWKQTAFYLKAHDQIDLKNPEDEITGFFQINGDSGNTRTFNIDLTFKGYSEQSSYSM